MAATGTKLIPPAALPITRRGLSRLMVGGGAALALMRPSAANARAGGMLVIGLDISDTVTFDPARQNNYSPPLTLEAAYDTLVTFAPGQYEDVRPLLATKWERTPDGNGWRFTLRPDVLFNTGNKVTPQDWKFSFDRILGLEQQTQKFLENVAGCAVSGADTFDIILKEPNKPLLSILAAPGFSVLDRQVARAHGAFALPGADMLDRATDWLNQNSIGTGPYQLEGWGRDQSIHLGANPNSWRGPPPFQRIVIRHMPDSAAQLQAVQRGDIDVAFNLAPDQIGKLRGDEKVRVEGLSSLDFVYLAINGDPELNKALAQQDVRQAIGYAIDYDGIVNRLLGGKAMRPASFLPIGVRGSTEGIAKEIGFGQNLQKAQALLSKAGLPDGFTFELSYARGAIAGVPYRTLAQRIVSDVARVGVTAKPREMDPARFRAQFVAGKLQSAVTFWNAPAVESTMWAAASVERVGKRVGLTPPADLVQLIDEAACEQDKGRQTELWIEYQRRMVELANLIVLFQPVYQVAVSNLVKQFPLTAAGWMANLSEAAPS